MSGGVTFYQDWDLEGSGNWSRLDDNGRVETQNHTDFNEINQRTVSSQNATPTHDKNGNMTDTGFDTVGGQSFPGGKRRLEFDALNRVRKVYNNNNTTTTSDDTLLAEYTYDAGNRRMQKVVTNSGSLNGTTRFYYLGWRVMEERDGSDAILQQYVYGLYLDEVWTRDDRRSSITVAQLNDASGTHRMFVHYNTLYHVYGLTDEAGALKEAYQYDAYGKQTVITDGNDGDAIVNFGANDVRTAGGNSTFTNPYMFTGQRFDAETGIMYYKNRYYSFDLGRFLGRDPIGYNAGPVGLYEYVESEPINSVDPRGKESIAFAFSAFISAGTLPTGWGDEPLDAIWGDQYEFSGDSRDFGEFSLARLEKNAGRIFSFGSIDSTKIGRASKDSVTSKTSTSGSHRWLKKSPSHVESKKAPHQDKGGDPAVWNPDKCTTIILYNVAGTYPFSSVAPSIDYLVACVFRKSDNGTVEWRVIGQHDEFPDYEAYVNRGVVPSVTAYTFKTQDKGPGLNLTRTTNFDTGWWTMAMMGYGKPCECDPLAKIPSLEEMRLEGMSHR